MNKNLTRAMALVGLPVLFLVSAGLSYYASTSAAPQSQATKATSTKDSLRKRAEKLYGTAHLGDLVVQAAGTGKASTGVVIHEASDKSELALDVDPCNGRIEVFTEPYKKTDTNETVKCNDKTFRLVRVTQKK